MLKGNVDLASLRKIEGWAQETRLPEIPVSLTVRADGIFIGQLRADRFREDLPGSDAEDRQPGQAIEAPICRASKDPGSWLRHALALNGATDFRVEGKITDEKQYLEPGVAASGALMFGI